jgi:cation diffusion facilitator family transporter
MTDPHDTERWQRIHEAAAPPMPGRERATRLVLLITAITMAIELVAGYLTGSMALVADGWHMSSHALAMGLAYVVHVAARSPFMRTRMSFGTGKISALGGYTSALLLAAVALGAGAQSVSRLVWPVAVSFLPAVVVAVGGLAVNIASVRILGRASHGPDGTAVEPAQAHAHPHPDTDPSHRAAIAHVLADAMTSVLAILALVGGRVFGWTFLDPLTGLAGCALVLFWAARLVRISARTLLDFTPASGVEGSVRDLIARTYDAVVADVHVWEFAPQKLACQLSLVAHEPLEPEHVKTTLAQISGLTHVTVEVNACREDH